MLDVKCSPGFVATFCVFPIKLLFNHRGRNVYGRRTEVLAGHTLFLKDEDVLPISHHPCGIIDIKLKIHIGFQGDTHTHRLHTLKNINKWKKHSTGQISVSRSWVRWVAFARRVALRGMLWMLIVYSMSINCNTPSSVRQSEHSSLHPSPPRTQKVSWTAAQINAPSVPAGVVSGSPGRRGTGPSLSNGSCVWFSILRES